ncbi:F0F1 ATP synthase subunit A [Verrucomicrobiota bacterium sgz303538]
MNIPTFNPFVVVRRVACTTLALIALVTVAGAPASIAADATQPAPGVALEAPAHDVEHHAGAHAEGAHGGHTAHHELPSYAVPLFYGFGGHAETVRPDGTVEPAKIGAFAVTNSMVLTWVVAIAIILFAQYATRNIKQVPEGAQNFWEFLVEGLRNFLENIIGRDLTRKTFWFFATIFIFILFTNWFGLIPGVGTVGWGFPNAQGIIEHIDKPLLRGANADLNMTLAMSMIFFVCWIVWALQANGFGGTIMHIFGPKGGLKGFMGVVMVVVFMVVGLLEVVSILFRPVSLSFRLFGNIFAGESLLEAMANVYPPLAPIIPLPFYFMELLVGLVQALVFMLLTAVFTLLICEHHEEGHEHGEAHH